MALTLKLDDIKPLLGAVGLGQDPTPAPKDVSNIAPPPMQMPPTPAAAGFSEWASDPQNAKKVSDGITQPGTPLLPPAPPPPSPQLGANMPPPPQMASANPPPGKDMSFLTPPDPNAGLSSKLGADQTELARLQSEGAGVSQSKYIKNPFLRTVARIGDAAGTILAPGVMSAVPGTTVHNWTLQNLKQGQVAGDQSNLKDALSNQDIQSQSAQRDALAAKANQQADDMTPFQLSPAQAQAINQPALAGTTATMRDYNRLLGQAGNNNTSSGNNAATNATKVTTNAATNATRVSTNAATNATKVTTNAATNATRKATNAASNAAKGSGSPTPANDPLVQAVIEGRAPAPSSRSKAAMAFMRAVTAADPTYDQSRYNTYQAMQKEMTTGKTGQAINSLNTIQEHIGRALQNMPDNTGSSLLNYGKNTVSEAFGGNPTGKYEVDATGIAGEWAKLVAGGVASEGEQKHVQSLLSPNASPTKMRENLAEVKAMTDGKLKGIQEQIASAVHPGPGSNPATSLPKGITPPPTGGQPTEGQTKVNSHGDKVKFSGGKWGPA